MLKKCNTGDFPETNLSTLSKPPYIWVKYSNYPHPKANDKAALSHFLSV